ncbi:MAG: flippase-like domain-containing protein [Candidatus Thermoplasmatota archaeon]|nr:flippase-like domain-containing protein [Candidatus Thermoplasmatota archaeon]
MRKFNLKKLSNFIPIIGIILFIYILTNIGVEKIASAFFLIPIHFYILATLPFILILILGSYKWKYICDKQKMDLGIIYLIKLYLINAFYVTIIPAGLGGYIKIFYIKKKSKASIEKCIINTLIDLTTGSVIGFFLALIGSIVIIKVSPGFFPVILIFFIFNLTAFFVFMKKSGGRRFYKFFIRPLIPKKYKEKIDASFESLYEDIPRIRDTILLFLFEITIWTIAALQVYIIAQAFSINIPFHMFLLIHSISVVAVVILPISMGGLGVREGVFVVLLYSLYGIEPYISVVISLSGYIVKTLIPAVIGMILTIKKESIL